MPTYVFHDTETDKTFEVFMKNYEEKVKLLEENSHIKSVLTASNLIGGVSMDSGKLPDGFKDRLRLIKQQHPLADGVSHLI